MTRIDNENNYISEDTSLKFDADLENHKIHLRSGKKFIIQADDISDGFHTFTELYAHRFALFAALAKALGTGFKAVKHHDGSCFEGYFICGMTLPSGKLITYHYEMALWDKFPGEVLLKGPEWDGHTAEDVVARLLEYADD